MNNQGSMVGITILTIIITAIIVGGSVFFFQKNSIKTVQEEITKGQMTNNQKPTTKEITTQKEKYKAPSIKTTETKKNSDLGPANIEWLTYKDNDVTFIYPKTFLGTSRQEDFDQNLGRDQWEITRQDDTIYIRPNFESPAAEFGSTYEIKILKDTWAADEEWSKAAEAHDGPESQWGEKLTTKATNYYVGVLRNLDLGLGQISDVYTLIPGGIDGRGKSKKPLEKHFVIYATPHVYQSYVEDILIPSLQAK